MGEILCVQVVHPSVQDSCKADYHLSHWITGFDFGIKPAGCINKHAFSVWLLSSFSAGLLNDNNPVRLEV